jgi:hypothetical protein
MLGGEFVSSLGADAIVAASSQEAFVRGDEGELVDARRCRYETVGRVVVLYVDFSRLERDLVIERGLSDAARFDRVTNPSARVCVRLEAATFRE